MKVGYKSLNSTGIAPSNQDIIYLKHD